MADAHRGVIFTFKARTDASVGREASRLSGIAAEAQKRFDSMHLGPLETGAFETSMTRLSESYQQHVSRMNGKKVAPQADVSGWKALSGAGKEALDSQKKWADGVRKLDAQRAADAKAAADAEVAEINRVQKERQKELRQTTKSDQGYWKDFEKHGQRSKKTRQQEQKDEARQEDHDRREAERRERLHPTTGMAGLSAIGREAIREKGGRGGNDKFQAGLKNIHQQREREQQQAQREESRTARDTELTLGRQREQYHRLGESIGATTDAVTRLGEGMAYLGLIGQRDLGRLSDSLLAIRGTVDTIRGGVGAMRDIGGLVRSVREVRHAGGVGGIGRAIMGMGPAVAAGTGAAGMGATGAGAVGGMAAAGTATSASGMAAAFANPAGIIVGGIAAAITLAADQAVAGGRFTRALGRSTGGMLKGAMRFADDVSMGLETVGKEEHEKRDIERERILYKRYDLKTGQEYDTRRPNERKGMDLTLPGLGLGATKVSELSDINRERAQQARELEKRKRGELGQSQAVGFEYATRNAQQRMDAVQRARAVGYNRQAADTQVDANSRPWEIQAGRRRAIGFRMREHEENKADAYAEERRTGEQLRTAAPGSPGRETAERQHEEAKRRIVDMEREGLDLAREQRTIEIDGARQRLQLMRDRLTLSQKQHRDSREEKKSLDERLGAMTPIERQALFSAQERVKKGTATRRDYELVERDGTEEGKERVRAHRIREGRDAREEHIKGGGSFGLREIGQESNARGNERDHRNKLNKGVEREQEQLGKGVDIGATVDNKITINIKPGDNFYQNLEQKYISSMQSFMTDQNERVSKWIEEAQARFEQTMDNRMAEQNQQGRNAAGGGGLP